MRRLHLSPSGFATGPLPKVLAILALVTYVCACSVSTLGPDGPGSATDARGVR